MDYKYFYISLKVIYIYYVSIFLIINVVLIYTLIHLAVFGVTSHLRGRLTEADGSPWGLTRPGAGGPGGGGGLLNNIFFGVLLTTPVFGPPAKNPHFTLPA